jgi:hypothetical protein
MALRQVVTVPLIVLLFLGLIRAEEEANPYQKDGDTSEVRRPARVCMCA